MLIGGRIKGKVSYQAVLEQKLADSRKFIKVFY